MLAHTMSAQQAQPSYTTVACLKVSPAQTAAYREFATTTTKALMQHAANSGRITSWSLMRAVMPTGSEARCDYMSVIGYTGTPPEPLDRESLTKRLASANIPMTADQYYAKRDSLSRLVSQEMFQSLIRVGQPAKGHYVFLNQMKVHKAADYVKFEREVWRPMAEQWVKQGDQSGWTFGARLFPSGTEVPHSMFSADVYPTWAAAFKNRGTQAVFEKAHPGKNYQETMAPLSSLRDLARRDLLRVEERVVKQ